jgi:hypothetical protein
VSFAVFVEAAACHAIASRRQVSAAKRTKIVSANRRKIAVAGIVDAGFKC